MKKLSDYKDEEALELWADLLEPLSIIFTDEEFKKSYFAKKSKLIIAKELIKNHLKETKEILQRIDESEINGLNIIIRVVSLLTELEKAPELKGFF